MSSIRIPFEDEEDLRWFFTRGTAAFQRSSMGSQQDRMRTFAYYRESMQACITKVAQRALEEGDSVDHEGNPLGDDLEGAVRIRRRPRSWRRLEAEDGSEQWDVDEESARITAELRRAQVRAPDERLLIRFAFVGRRLQRVASYSAPARETLERYYGDAGFRAAQFTESGQGQLLSVFALVPATEAMLKRAADERRKAGQPDLGLSRDERIESEVAAERLNGSKRAWRSELLRVARYEAQQLLAEASAVWTRAARELPRPPKARPRSAEVA